MRSVVRKRIIFLIIAIALYIFGFQTIQPSLHSDSSLELKLFFLLSVTNYFIVIPILYWYLIIKAGKQKPWKLFIILSISSTCARFSFPASIAEYFEFVMWLRYPIIGILLIIELYLIKTVFVGLWQARKLKGDPRINAFEKFKENDKKLMASLFISWEPAGWYYAISKFSKRHPPSIGKLNLYSSNISHYLALVIGCLSLSTISYLLLIEWSEIAAIIISSIILWTLVAITANYRISKNYSIYCANNNLIINNSFLGFIIIKLSEIESIEVANFPSKENHEQLSFGNSKNKNVQLKFSKEQMFVGGMGSSPEQINQVQMSVEDPKLLAENINQAIAEKNESNPIEQID